MKIRDIDHITIFVTNLDKTIRFYHEVFDMPTIEADDQHVLMLCGKQGIEFCLANHPGEPTPVNPFAGSAAFCFIVREQLADVENHLRSYYVPIIAGPTEKQGAHGKLTSLFIQDPDANILEIAVDA